MFKRIQRHSSLGFRNLPERWSSLNQTDQKQLAESLFEAQKGDWKQLTLEQKRALYYIAYGAHGPRAELPEGFYKKVALGTFGTVLAAAALFIGYTQMFMKRPTTITKEWQEAANEKAREQMSDPYTGKGHLAKSM